MWILRVQKSGIKGIKRVISISKIRKIKLIKKNWILKGILFDDRGSNPHSRGEIFSRERIDFLEIRKFNINIKIDKRRIRSLIIVSWKIIYIKCS